MDVSSRVKEQVLESMERCRRHAELHEPRLTCMTNNKTTAHPEQRHFDDVAIASWQGREQKVWRRRIRRYRDTGTIASHPLAPSPHNGED